MAKVRFRITSKRGDVLRDYDDDRGRSLTYQSDNRAVVVRRLPLLALPAGQYRLHVILEDSVAKRGREQSVEFAVSGRGTVARNPGF